MFTPPTTVAYEGLVAYAAQTAMKGAAPILGPCAVELEAVFAVPASASKRARADALEGRAWPAKKPDADNIVKACLDGMNGVVWKDDVQAVDVRLVKRYGLTPGVWVRVAAL
jgi:Holliday junction resolvase RusA-like endonuclease